MWRLRKSNASRVVLRRISALLAAPLIVASFLTVFVSSTPVFAATAEWDGPILNYEGNQYTEGDPASFPAGSHTGDVPYVWVDQSVLPQKAYVIFFDTDQPQEEKDAELVSYVFIPPDNYTGPSSPETIDVTVDLTGGSVDTGDVPLTTCDSSMMGGVGWLLCPISNWIADGVDAMYRIVNDFLEVPIVTSDSNTGVYQLWSVLLSIANVCFAFVFIVIIYSHLTSAGFSNYNIKIMLPRLLIAAVLVNISFWLCALAIDVSNLLGHSINNVFINIRENMPTGAQVDWSMLNIFIMSAGTVGAIAGFAAAAGGSWAGLGFLLIAALAGVAFAIFVAFVILAARQAIITVLLVISPLAFVAFVLPSTQEWFTKWRKSFTTLLMLFPIFAVLFGGSGVAGAAIMNAADGRLHILLIGMATQIIPLVLTPLLIQFSSGLLGRIAGMANNSTRGLADRAKNWAHDNADYHKSNKLAKGDKASSWKRPYRALNPTMLGRAMDQGKRRRDLRKSENEDLLGNRANAQYRKELANGTRRSDVRRRQQYMDSHDLHKQAETYKGELDQAAEKHWQSTLDASDKQHFNRDVFASVVNTQKLKYETEEKEANLNAILAEMKAGVNPYTNADDATKRRLGGIAGLQSIDEIAKSMQETADNILLEKDREQSAEIKFKTDHTALLKENAKIRDYAGGIDELGATRVYASAIETASSEYMKNVAAVTSVFSNEGYNAQEMMDVAQRKITKLKDGTALNDVHVHAAVQRINAEIGNNWAVQKMADYVADMGMSYNEQTKDYTDKNGVVLSKKEVESRRDMQQMFRDAYNKGKVRVSTISQTDLSAMENGTYVVKTTNEDGSAIPPVTLDDGTTRMMLQSERAMVRDMRTDKFSEDRWITEDIDVLSRYVQALRSDDIRTQVDSDQRTGLADQINRTLTNPHNRSKIKGREGQLLQVIEKYLRADDGPISHSDKQAFEKEYERRTIDDHGNIIDSSVAKTTAKVPTYYTVENQNDFEDRRGNKLPTGPA